LFTEIEVALFVAFINGVLGGKAIGKKTKEEEKEMLNFYCAGTASRSKY
jgi:hypothetical protein